MSPPYKLPPSSDEEVILESLPDATVEIAAGIELPKDEPVPEPEHEPTEWERAGVRPPQRFRV